MSLSPLPPLQSCLPHRGGMLLIHRLLQADDETALVEVDVRPDSPFAQPEGMPAWVGLEYMAQAVAAWAGVRAQRAGRKPRLGFLLGTRRYEAHTPLFAHGTTLQVQVRCELMADNGLGQFECQISASGHLLCQAKVSVFEPEDAGEVLGGAR
ncbi:ApeP family dehydratase [Ideonella paludis]|uniref:3-hydroxylacyl-ACP dehydratase n=1 Tax=Ideonella paludis TaxID=1233411 RepID=A0ABS5DSV9_9BURK|nr:3-hydroxylacyl-ACP dehydratase [Ideonella paludis]